MIALISIPGTDEAMKARILKLSQMNAIEEMEESLRHKENSAIEKRPINCLSNFVCNIISPSQAAEQYLQSSLEL